MGVAFSPTSAGAQSGTLSVTSSALALTQQVVLTGTGFDFTMAVSGSPGQTVASGQTANYTLVLTPLNGSSGTFSFTCGSLPAHAACTFNPSSTTVNANMTGNVTVEVVTGNASASLERRTLPWRAAPLLCGLLLLPLGFAKKRRVLLLIAVLGILVGGVASCSGSGGGSGGSGGGGSGSNTPAGSYTIPVTATANGISHQTSLSLTVD